MFHDIKITITKPINLSYMKLISIVDEQAFPIEIIKVKNA